MAFYNTYDGFIRRGFVLSDNGESVDTTGVFSIPCMIIPGGQEVNSFYNEIDFPTHFKKYNRFVPDDERFIVCPDKIASIIAKVIVRGKKFMDKNAVYSVLIGSRRFCDSYAYLSSVRKNEFYNSFVNSFPSQFRYQSIVFFNMLTENKYRTFYEIMNDFSLFFIFNELIQSYLETGKIYTVADFNHSDNAEYTNKVFNKFNNLDISIHRYTAGLFNRFFKDESFYSMNQSNNRYLVKTKELSLYSFMERREYRIPKNVNVLDMIDLSSNKKDVSSKYSVLRSLALVGNDFNHAISEHEWALKYYFDNSNYWGGGFSEKRDNFILSVRNRIREMRYNDYTNEIIRSVFREIEMYILKEKVEKSHLTDNTHKTFSVEINSFKMLSTVYLVLKVNELGRKSISNQYIRDIVEEIFGNSGDYERGLMSDINTRPISIESELDKIDNYAHYIVNSNFHVPYPLIKSMLTMNTV